MSFKKYMISEIEKYLDDLPEKDQKEKKNVKIVDIVFSYSNHDLLNLLRTRGSLIT